MKAEIFLKQIYLDLHLGWPEAERLQKQTVFVDISIRFLKFPKACHTDQLEDTFGYEFICRLLSEKIAVRQFRLIEYLGYEIYQLLKKELPVDTHLKIGISKKPPGMPLETVSFTFEDQEFL